MKIKIGLIGSHIKVTKSKNKSLVGIEGVVIDETRNTILLKNGKQKKIIKNHVELEIK